MVLYCVTFIHMLLRLRWGGKSRVHALFFGGGWLAYFALAASVGMVRSWQGGFSSAYAMYTNGALLLSYLYWSAVGGRLSRFIRFGLVCLLCAASMWTQGEGVRKLREYRTAEAQFWKDAETGIPPLGLASRNALGASSSTLQSLRDQGFSRFANVPGDWPCQALELGPESQEWLNAGEPSDRFRGLRGKDSFVVLKLERPRRVFAIELVYSVRMPEKHLEMEVRWITCANVFKYDQIRRETGSRSFWRAIHKLNATQVFWINDEVSSIAVYPSSGNCEFALHTVRLLCKPE